MMKPRNGREKKYVTGRREGKRSTVEGEEKRIKIRLPRGKEERRTKKNMSNND